MSKKRVIILAIAAVLSFNTNAQIGNKFKKALNSIKEKVTDRWAKQYEADTSGKEADLVIRIGDIDNFGFGWPEDFDPFSGQETPVHPYPFSPSQKDAPGTDRIMVGSSFSNNAPYRDGYASNSSRPDNQPRPCVLNYTLGTLSIKSANLQVFMDDFQPTRFASKFVIKLNGVRLDNFERAVNSFDQHGPVGKLVTISILPEYLHLLKEGKVELFFDDPYTGNGDGFAVDFVRLIINPKNNPNVGTISGIVVDEAGSPIENAVVNANQQVVVNTANNGAFTLSNVAAGLVSISAAKSGYSGATESFDLFSGQNKQCTLKLNKLVESGTVIERQLKQSGKITLYGLYFDVNKSELKPESYTVLNELFVALKNIQFKKVLISGHTDSDGDDTYNATLSARRAEEVQKWLSSKGINKSTLVTIGYGESRPISSNISNEGKALNRRVEVEVVE